MATICLPENSIDFRKFVKNANEEKDESKYIWTFWTDLIISAASVGVYYNERNPEIPVLKSDPDPIKFETFKREYYDYILMISLFATNNPEIVDNEEEMCKIIQEYAAAGFRHMSKAYFECGGKNHWVDAWEYMIRNCLE